MLFLTQEENSVELENKNAFLARPLHHLPGFWASHTWRAPHRDPPKYWSLWLVGGCCLILARVGWSFYICLWLFPWGWLSSAPGELTLVQAVCWEVFTETSAPGGFYTYLTLGSLQTSCREEETFPLPQDNLPSYRKRVDVSGWSVWMWKRSLHVLLLCPKGQF